MNVLAVGCTEAQVGSIAKMNEQMVPHYRGEVNLWVLVKGGMIRLENKWAEVRPEVLERE